MSVSKEKNGTYTVQCWYRERLTGERRKKTKRGFARKAEATQWERDFLTKIAGSPTMRFSDFFQVYKVTPSHKGNSLYCVISIITPVEVRIS